MKHLLQHISLLLALLTIMIACNKDNSAETANNTNPPPSPPLPPIDSAMTTFCSQDKRTLVLAELVPVGTLSQRRAGMAVAAVGNKILFAGGGVSDETGSKRVDIFDVAANTWSTAELSIARYGIAAVAAGNKVFFAGGYWYNWDRGLYKPHATIDIYDAENNTWSVAQLSEPRANLAAAVVGDKVFFAGGEIDIASNTSATVDIYNLSTGAWTTARLSAARANMSAVTLNNKIYFAGGNGSPATASRIDIYDNATNSWSIDTLKHPMTFLTGIAVDNKIYWATDCGVEIKDVQTGVSTEASLFRTGWWMSTFGQQAVLKDNKIVFYRHDLYDKADKFDIYDIRSQKWSIGVVRKEYRETSIISVNNTIYLAGGFADRSTHSNEVWKLVF